MEETAERITLRGESLEASIKKMGYVSGVEAGSFLDKKTGARDLGFGLDIQDWIMEPVAMPSIEASCQAICPTISTMHITVRLRSVALKDRRFARKQRNSSLA